MNGLLGVGWDIVAMVDSVQRLCWWKVRFGTAAKGGWVCCGCSRFKEGEDFARRKCCLVRFSVPE